MPDATTGQSERSGPWPGEGELLRAARVGDHERVRELARGCEIDAEFGVMVGGAGPSRKLTALMVAAGSGDGASVETVRLLMELGADARRVVGGYSAAHCACMGVGFDYGSGGDAARLELLLGAGAPITLHGRKGDISVARVAGNGDAGRLRILLKLGASANVLWGPEDALAFPIPMRAVSADDGGTWGSGNGVEIVPNPYPPDWQPVGPYSWKIPIFAAAESGSGECVRLLVASGANIEQRCSLGETPLMYAATVEAAAALLDAGASIDAVKQGGLKDDVLAAVLDREEGGKGTGFAVSRFLLARGAPLVRSGVWGVDRLHSAAFRENLGAVRFLLEVGHPAVPPAGTSTALHAICWQGDHSDERDETTRQIVLELLAAGTDPNSRDEWGRTPLHEAVVGDWPNVIAMEELLRAGADPDARDNEGRTPLAYGYERGFDYERFVPPLLRHGANPLIADSDGQTVIDLAEARYRGKEPQWRVEQWAEKGGLPCGWKGPAAEGDPEHAMLLLLHEAAKRFEP